MRHSHLLLVLSFVTAGLATPHAQNKALAVVAPGENLVVDGIPTIPASLADDVGRYTESRPANFADWHPTRPGDADLDALREHRANPSGQGSRGRANSAHLLQRADRRRLLRAGAGPLFRVRQGRRGNEFAQLYPYDVAATPTSSSTRL